MSVNLSENTDSGKQREILDALPVLVFLERGGKIVFANAEARQQLGQTEGEWIPRAVEDVLWGLFPGTAEPQTLLLTLLSAQVLSSPTPGQKVVPGHVAHIDIDA